MIAMTNLIKIQNCFENIKIDVGFSSQMLVLIKVMEDCRKFMKNSNALNSLATLVNYHHF